MATKYYAVLTNVGAAKLANATALGAQVEITQMAVGDGNGVLPTPNPAQTALVHELRRKPLNSLSIDPNNANQIIAEQVIPEDEGGWWIREIGLFDKDGDMIAVANCAETYKPQLQEGSGRVQVVRMILIVSSTAAVTLKIDPSVVLATRKYVDDQIIQVKSYVDQKMAAHVAAADPHKQYAPKESPALTGRPTAPTAEGKDSSTQIANTAFVQAAIAALVGSSPEALDTLNELAAALGNDPNFATTVTNSLAGKMDKSANGSDIENVSVFLQNLGFSEYIKGLIGKGDQWSAWQYLGLVDALNGKQQADATLTALAGLVNGANKLPYFSGVDQMATADLTAFARGLLGKADAETAKGHLGVGSAGGRNVGAGFSSGGSEIPDMTFFAGLKGAAGYQYFPNGTLLQWGTVGLKSAPSGTSIGTFPVAFPGAGQQIVVTHDNPLTNVMAFGAASIINPTQFRVNAIAINADTFTMAPGYNLTLRWFAIGS
ncbi:phage tail protein [Enterobacter roggenkampii]|uniref:phage tail protein n=1 Tax=Enterobacter roggenkampii TaxID=1812935 RepID=UPI000A61E35C|nr:phage tail protein [Enterobacter roggenkampii]